MTDQNRILLSETTRCARQQWLPLLLFLVLGLLNYYLCNQGSWTAWVPTAGSLEIFYSYLALGHLLSSLLITIPWLLLTQATLQHSAITLQQLIRRSVRLFPKLVAVQVITGLLLSILGFITIAFTTTLSALLFRITGTIGAPSGMISREFLYQLLSSKFWLSGTLLTSLFLFWYVGCHLFFTAYIVITEPQVTLLASLRLSWRWSKPCRSHLLVATLLFVGLLTLPSFGLQFSSLRTNPWVNIGFALYSSALGLVASIYFLVLYQQQRALPEQSLNLSKR